ncbi:MAG: hypothetical protein ACRCUP_00170 [Mycoplasmatales bacterium]
MGYRFQEDVKAELDYHARKKNDKANELHDRLEKRFKSINTTMLNGCQEADEIHKEIANIRRKLDELKTINNIKMGPVK